MPHTNALFGIFAVANAEAVEKRLQTVSPWLYLSVGTGQWLLIAPSATTSKEVSDKVGLGTSDPVTTGLVVRVENYFGRNSSSVWEWIVTKMGAELVTTTSA